MISVPKQATSLAAKPTDSIMSNPTNPAACPAMLTPLPQTNGMQMSLSFNVKSNSIGGALPTELGQVSCHA